MQALGIIPYPDKGDGGLREKVVQVGGIDRDRGSSGRDNSSDFCAKIFEASLMCGAVADRLFEILGHEMQPDATTLDSGLYVRVRPALQQLFPRSMLVVLLNDAASCSIVCKCAVLIGWWQRMGWPSAVLRRAYGSSETRRDRWRHQSNAGHLVLDFSDWRNQGLRDFLVENGADSVTLAGSDLDGQLLQIASVANAERIPTMIISDAVEGSSAPTWPNGHSRKRTLRGVAPTALSVPMAEFVPAVEAVM